MFRLAAVVVIPASFFLLLELSLRVFGFGNAAGFVLDEQIDGVPVHVQNERYYWRFFPKAIARYTNPFSIPIEKPQDTYRIFILGGSAAMGTPDPTLGFCRILEVSLRERFPAAHFEVINAAAVAINSHVVLETAKECADLQPDLFVVYLGNNEVVGPFGAGTVLTPFSPYLSLIRANVLLGSTRVGQLVNHLMSAASDGSPSLRQWRGLEMFLENQFSASDAALETVYRHFEQNLTDICQTARKAGIPVIVCTVATNLKDSAPFASLHRGDLTDEQKQQWERAYERGIDLESKGDHGQALREYRSAAEIDDRYADLHFRLGRCYWAMADYKSARQHYIEAREQDTLRFRADTRINDIIRSVGGSRDWPNVRLVDVEKVFEKNSPHATVGREFFHEHVHFNFRGNYLVSRSILAQIERLLPDWAKRDDKARRDPLTIGECAGRLALTEWDRFRIVTQVLNSFIGRPPFTGQLDHPKVVRALEDELNKLRENMQPEVFTRADAQYRRAIESNPSDVWLRYNYAAFLSSPRQNPRAAEEQLRICLKTLPRFPAALNDLGFSLVRQQRFKQAEGVFERSLDIIPYQPDVHFIMATVCGKLGRSQDENHYLREALALDPNHVQTLLRMGDLCSDRSEFDEAVGYYRRVIGAKPDLAEAHHKLAVALTETNAIQEALEHYREAVRLKPDWPSPMNNLAWVLATHPDPDTRNPADAVHHAERAAELTQRQSSSVLDTLAAAYAAAGDFDQAVATAETAISRATAVQNLEAAQNTRERLELYRQTKPYRDPAFSRKAIGR